VQCDPAKGDVAFSQPTSSGKALMDAWGGGDVRVFVEDEQQSDAEE
jgi:N-acetyltransferase